jgi:hypothetical protein
MNAAFIGRGGARVLDISSAAAAFSGSRRDWPIAAAREMPRRA